MDDCKHVKQVKLAVDKSFLNPRNWNCSECGTTESVWVREVCYCWHCWTVFSSVELKYLRQLTIGMTTISRSLATCECACVQTLLCRHVFCAVMWLVEDPVRSML